MNIEEYKGYIKTKIIVLQRVNENLLSQYTAIKAKDTVLLGKLLKRQQANTDKLNRISLQLGKADILEKDADLERYEANIDSMLRDAIQTAAANIECAEGLKSEIGNSIYQLKVSENAIKNGYFKRIQPQHGYFFDKKK